MKIETTSAADVACKDLIGEAYEAAYERYPDFGIFSGINALWDEVQAALKVDMCTTGDEDDRATDLLSDVFEEACRAALEDGYVDFASGYVDYKALWERLCAVLGVKV